MMSKGAGGLLTKEEAGASRPHLFPPSCAPVSHSNHTLRFMSFPVSDISQAYRSAPERTEDVWQKVQGTILSRVGQQGAGGQPTSPGPDPPTPSSPDPMVLSEEQPLPDVPPGAGLQVAAGPGDQQRRASKRFPLGHRGHTWGMQGTGVM